MFQAAELGQKVSDKEFKERVPALWHNLLMQQQRLRKEGASATLIDFAGVRGAGRSECVNTLNKWMDARWINTHGFGEETEAQSMRPHMWRYWMRNPPRGQIGMFLSGRYSVALLDYVHGRVEQDTFVHSLQRINAYERMLAEDGALVLKFWMHIGRDEQKKRLQRLQDDPLNSWRITELDWEHWKLYDRFIEAAEQIISLTNTEHAPWEIVEGQDPNYRNLRVGEVLLDSLDRHITRISVRNRYQEELEKKLSNGNGNLEVPATGNSKTVFSDLDMSKDLKNGEYREQLEYYETHLSRLQNMAREKNLTTILVFEGSDAAGKGGAIRRITNVLDARYYKIYPFAAPTDEESAQHYLWRFWRCLPRSGRLTVFDRSWYGRVLVERVEKYATDVEWRRAYSEINQFEDELVDDGILLLKFWVSITKEEQLKRFKRRETMPHKQWKLTDEDWRNREKWDEYQHAAHDMVQMTGTHKAPWILVEGDSKQYARIKVLKSLYEAGLKALGERE